MREQSSGQLLVERLVEEIVDSFGRLRRLHRTFLVDDLTRGYVKALKRVRRSIMFKSRDVLRALMKTLKRLREALDRSFKLRLIGVREAWKISEIAASWGHPSALEWRRQSSFIIWCGMHSRWMARLFGPGILQG